MKYTIEQIAEFAKSYNSISKKQKEKLFKDMLSVFCRTGLIASLFETNFDECLKQIDEQTKIAGKKLIDYWMEQEKANGVNYKMPDIEKKYVREILPRYVSITIQYELLKDHTGWSCKRF
jgi:hypothetical protein